MTSPSLGGSGHVLSYPYLASETPARGGRRMLLLNPTSRPPGRSAPVASTEEAIELVPCSGVVQKVHRHDDVDLRRRRERGRILPNVAAAERVLAFLRPPPVRSSPSRYRRPSRRLRRTACTGVYSRHSHKRGPAPSGPSDPPAVQRPCSARRSGSTPTASNRGSVQRWRRRGLPS